MENNIRSDNKHADGTILVFGMPRSGTTWLGKIFDSHSLTLYRHEPDSWRRFSKVPLMPAMTDALKYVEAISRFDAALAGFNVAKVCTKQPLFRKKYLSDQHFLALKLGAMLAQLVDRTGFSIPVIGSVTHRPENARIVWKSIESLGRLGVIMTALPRSKAVHIIRHPCGFVASVLRGEAKRKFQDNRGASEDYGIFEMLLETEAAKEVGISLSDLKELSPEERLAWRWALSTEKAIRDTRDTDRCMLVRYEDLCHGPVPVVRSLFDFVGLNFDHQTELFLGTSVSRQDDSYYSVHKNPARVVNRWQEDLDGTQIKRIIDVARLTSSGRLFLDSA